MIDVIQKDSLSLKLVKDINQTFAVLFPLMMLEQEFAAQFD